MKKSLSILICLSALVGCVGAKPKTTYTPPPDLAKLCLSAASEVAKCLKTPFKIGMYKTEKLFAMADADRVVYVSEGFVMTDYDTLRFVLAHEVMHLKLNHIRNARIASGAVTGAMMVVGAFIPGAGLLNHAVNPAVVNNYSKSQEAEADKAASEACLECFGLSIERQVGIMNDLRKASQDGGGFWDRHPSWDERIQNIQGVKGSAPDKPFSWTVSPDKHQAATGGGR